MNHDVAQLAAQAVAILTPVLPAVKTVATQVSEGFLKEPGKKLFDWLFAKVKGTAAEAALERAIDEPQNPRRLASLRLEIEDLAEKDAGFGQQLADFISGLTGEISATQTAAVSGDNNKVAQTTGTNNKIRIG